MVDSARSVVFEGINKVTFSTTFVLIVVQPVPTERSSILVCQFYLFKPLKVDAFHFYHVIFLT